MADPTSSFPKALYTNGDRRTNWYGIDSLGLDPPVASQMKAQVESVACLIKRNNLLRSSDNPIRYQIPPHVSTLAQFVPQISKGVPFSENERFREEPVAGFGTAFLIGQQLALTAAHCVCDDNHPSRARIEAMHLVFGFYMIGDNQCRREFEERDVYQVENVLAYAKTDSSDWAILKLNREVEGRSPLRLNLTDEVPKGIPLYMLGHPTGLPLKLVTEAEVKEDRNPDFFGADLDSFAGNSGSPVFDQRTQEVVGILYRGQEDYVLEDDYKGSGESRMTAARHSGFLGWEKCVRVASLNFLKAALPSIDTVLPDDMDKSSILPGLNLVGRCTRQSCDLSGKSIVFPFGMGKRNLNELCCKLNCSDPDCKNPIDFDNVNLMVLSSCQYKIVGRNQERTKIEQAAFSKLLFGRERVMQFDIRQWRYINVETVRL
jgi:hypothetical protein